MTVIKSDISEYNDIDVKELILRLVSHISCQRSNRKNASLADCIKCYFNVVISTWYSGEC